jgi:hypothetical protein
MKRLGDDAADDWVFRARDAQLPPPDLSWCWLFLGGRLSAEVSAKSAGHGKQHHHLHAGMANRHHGGRCAPARGGAGRGDRDDDALMVAPEPDGCT